MASPIERTAVADFKLGTTLVRKGDVVMVASKGQLKKLVDAGCVVETDEENDQVPKSASVIVAESLAATALMVAKGDAEIAHSDAAVARIKADKTKAKEDIDAADSADIIAADAQAKADAMSAGATKA